MRGLRFQGFEAQSLYDFEFTSDYAQVTVVLDANLDPR